MKHVKPSQHQSVFYINIETKTHNGAIKAEFCRCSGHSKGSKTIWYDNHIAEASDGGISADGCVCCSLGSGENFQNESNHYKKRPGVEEAGVKWPNDVLVNQKKLAGILTDCSITGSSIVALVGIGVRQNS